MSSLNKPTEIEGKFADDDESKPTVQSQEEVSCEETVEPIAPMANSTTTAAQPPASGSQTNAATTQALKQLLITLRNTPNNPQAQLQVLNILKSQPVLRATFIKQRQEQQEQQKQQQLEQELVQQVEQLEEHFFPEVDDPVVAQPQVPGTETQALKQLLTTLRKANNSPQAQQQVLAILKSQPALMATFIKQRQELQKRLQQKPMQPDIEKQNVNSINTI